MTDRAYGVLTDLSLHPMEALRSYRQISRRWTPINAGFVLHFGLTLRLIKIERGEHDGLAKD